MKNLSLVTLFLVLLHFGQPNLSAQIVTSEIPGTDTYLYYDFNTHQYGSGENALYMGDNGSNVRFDGYITWQNLRNYIPAGSNILNIEFDIQWEAGDPENAWIRYEDFIYSGNIALDFNELQVGELLATINATRTTYTLNWLTNQMENIVNGSAEDVIRLGMSNRDPVDPNDFAYYLENIPLRITYTPNEITVTQIDEDGNEFGAIDRLLGSNWQNFNVPYTTTLPSGSALSLKGDQELKQGTHQKYFCWTQNDNKINTNPNRFTTETIGDLFTAIFYPAYAGITIQNSIEGTTLSGGSIKIADPWYIDLQDGIYANSWRNRGMQEPRQFYPRSVGVNGWHPDFTTVYSESPYPYKGVFLNQDYTIEGNPYYSVQTMSPQPITLDAPIGERIFYFQRWYGTDASIENPSSSSTGVNFHSEEAEVSAHLKGQGLSDDQNAYSSGSQRKFIKSSDGMPVSVYSSMGDIWLEAKPYSSWIINGGAPINSDSAKGPSLDYASYSYQGGEPVHELLVVFQEKSVNNSNIIIKYYEQLSALQNMSWWILKDSYSFTAVIGRYDDFDCTPVIAFYPAGQDFKLVYRGLDGLYLKTGTIRPSNMPPPGGTTGITSNDPPVKIAGTSATSKNPSIYAMKTNSYRALVWEDQNTIKYSDHIPFTINDIQTISDGDGFSTRNNPSVVVMDDHSAKVVWKAERRYYPDGGISPFRQTAVIFKDPGVGGFNQFGSNVGNPNINRADEGSFFAFAWSENDGATNKFADNNLSSYWTMPNNTGTDVQISNGPNKFSMYAELFNSSIVPHYFKTSPNLASMQYETPVIHGTDEPSVGREGTISAGHAQFFFNFGDISVADSSIGFIPLPQHPSYDSVGVLNEYSLTEAFNIYDGIDFLYTILYGTTDSTGAAALLVDGNYVSYNLYLVDDATGEVIAPLDNVVFEEGNIFQYANIRYQLETTGLGNRRVRMKLMAANNFEAEYSLNASYTDGSESLEKALIKKKKAIAPITEYAITQNFPNPFNPATTINYQIPQTGFVTLKIYDILGKEVATLVNEQKTQGRYTVNFDASRLASGVYIYQLRVNDYVSSRKMLLLK